MGNSLTRPLSAKQLRSLAARAHTIHVKISAIWREVESDEYLKETAGYAMCGVAEISTALRARVRTLTPKD